MSIGSLILTPSFDGGVTEYAADTTNATNTITAVATDPAAVIEILVDATPVDNGTPATWVEGVNIVTITVTKGAYSVVYTVTVTKA